MEDSIEISFSELEGCYGQLSSWCDLLEAIADFIPCQIDERLSDTITNGLIPLLLTSYRFEECIFSTERGLIHQGDACERRRTNRSLEYDAAKQVVETLISLKEGTCRLSWDIVGDQLRSFIISMRRHIRSERESIKLIKMPTYEATRCNAYEVARTEAV